MRLCDYNDDLGDSSKFKDFASAFENNQNLEII